MNIHGYNISLKPFGPLSLGIKILLKNQLSSGKNPSLVGFWIWIWINTQQTSIWIK